MRCLHGVGCKCFLQFITCPANLGVITQCLNKDCVEIVNNSHNELLPLLPPGGEISRYFTDDGKQIVDKVYVSSGAGTKQWREEVE